MCAIRSQAVPSLLVGLCLLAAGPVRAGQLDRGLLRKGGHVLHYLNDRGYRNVGVLPFQVTRGERSASSQPSPLALTLAPRLENTLVMSQDPTGRTIGIIRGASATAARGRVGAYPSS